MYPLRMLILSLGIIIMSSFNANIVLWNFTKLCMLETEKINQLHLKNETTESINLRMEREIEDENITDAPYLKIKKIDPEIFDLFTNPRIFPTTEKKNDSKPNEIKDTTVPQSTEIITDKNSLITTESLEGCLFFRNYLMYTLTLSLITRLHS